MNNLWEEKRIKDRVLKMYFEEKKAESIIAKKIIQEEKIALSKTKIKKDIGRIVHRKLDDIKLNRKENPIGKCPICSRDVFLRDRTKQREKFSCICEGVYINKCYFRLTKTVFGLTLYNNIIEQLLKNKETKVLKNLIYKDKKIQGKLILNLQKKGFIDIKSITNEEKEINKKI